MKLIPLSAALLALSAPAAAQTVPPTLQEALRDAGRPETDTARDAARHPGEILAFAGVKPGDKVGDFFTGSGYWSRILAKAVGPHGHVYAFQPSEFARGTEPSDALKSIAAANTNVTISQTPAADVTFAEPLDLILTFENWHDLHLTRFTTPDFGKATARKLFAALKPGGVLLVGDHVAVNDPEMKAPNSIHRIEPAAARREIESAGFVFEGELPVLRNPADPHTAGVFDASIRGKTDQFVYKFRKPRR